MERQDAWHDPDAQVVAGAAELEVVLGTLAGALRFTDMESWIADTTPGAVGTRSRWLDGDLHYGVKVRGTTFIQDYIEWTDVDEGIITGAFFGAAHEGMGGTLKREDIAAGFGGTRE